MIRHMLRLMGKPESLLSYVQDRPGHDRRYALDCKKLETELGLAARDFIGRWPTADD